MSAISLFSHRSAAIPHTDADKLKYVPPTHLTDSVYVLPLQPAILLVVKRTTVLLSVPQLPFDGLNLVAGQCCDYLSADKQTLRYYIPVPYSGKEYPLPLVPDDKDVSYFHKPDRPPLPATADAMLSHPFLPPYGHFHKAAAKL